MTGRMLVRLLMSVVVWGVLSGNSYATATLSLAEARNAFVQGNAAYRVQDFETAREFYRSLLEAGYDEAQVLYNLGTVEAQLGNMTYARAYLLRARALDPRNDDIRANLEFVSPSLAPGDRADEKDAVASWIDDSVWSRVYGFFTLGEWMWMAWGGLMLACCGGAVILLTRRVKVRRVGQVCAVAGAVVLLLVAVPGVSQYYHTRILRKAMVLDGAQLHSGPADRFAGIAEVEEGEVVRVLDHAADDFQRVQLRNGTQGYVRRASIMML